MPIELHWEDADRTVINYTFIAPYTWSEFEEANTECWHMVSSAPGPVDMILDVSQIDRMPRNAHIHVPDALKNLHPNLRTIVFVGLNVYTRAIRNGMARMFPHRIGNSRAAWSHEQAVQMIREGQVLQAVG